MGSRASSRCKVGIELSSGCNKIRCTCNHYQWYVSPPQSTTLPGVDPHALTNRMSSYYCRASLISVKDEDDIQVAQEEAEDASKKSLADSGGLDARAIELRDDYAQKRRAADKKAYTGTSRAALPRSTERQNALCIPTPNYCTVRTSYGAL